jgi:hypothetical protein
VSRFASLFNIKTSFSRHRGGRCGGGGGGGEGRGEGHVGDGEPATEEVGGGARRARESRRVARALEPQVGAPATWVGLRGELGVDCAGEGGDARARVVPLQQR